MKKKTTFLASLAAFTILFTGCAGDKSSGSSSEPTSSGTSGTTSAATTSDTAETTSQTTIQTTTQDTSAPAEPTEESSQPDIPTAEPSSEDSTVPPGEELLPPAKPWDTVTVDYAQGDYANYTIVEFDVTGEEPQVRVLFTASAAVTDFKVLSLTCEDIDENGNISFSVQERYSQPELTPESPLVVGMEFFGSIPNNGISYVDTDGVEKRFAVNMSGEDGSLYLWEF